MRSRASVRVRAVERDVARSLFIFGARSYVARSVASQLLATNDATEWRVSGSSRTPDGAPASVQLHEWPLDERGRRAVLEATHVLSAIPPSIEGVCPVLAAVGKDLRRRREEGASLYYLSSTGVYGDHGGAWVDEESPLLEVGRSRKGSARAVAEREWIELGAHVFRLGGVCSCPRPLRIGSSASAYWLPSSCCISVSTVSLSLVALSLSLSVSLS